MSRVFLFTGSRDWLWDDVPIIVRAINEHMRLGDTLRHGGAPGVDRWAGQLWESFGPVEVFPADDFATPLLRNLHMIKLQPVPVACLAFALSWRSGTGHCARHARKAGISTFDYGVDTRSEARG